MIDHVLRGDSAPRANAEPRISSLQRTQQRRVRLIEELRGHESRGRLEVHQTVTRDDSTAWAGRRGRIGRSHFESVVHDPAQTLCFVCGPARW